MTTRDYIEARADFMRNLVALLAPHPPSPEQTEALADAIDAFAARASEIDGFGGYSGGSYAGTRNQWVDRCYRAEWRVEELEAAIAKGAPCPK